MQELQAELQAGSTDPGMLKGQTKLKLDQLKFLEGKLATVRLHYQAKMESIERWRIQMKAKLQVTDDGPEDRDLVLPTEKEAEFLEAILKRVSIRIEDPDEKADFESTFQRYVERLKDREQNLHRCYAKTQNLKSHLTELVGARGTLSQTLKDCEQSNVKYKADLAGVLLRERALEQQKNDSAAQLEFELRRQGEDQFDEFLKKNEAIFKGVKRTYGAKIAEKIKQEHKKEINEIAIAQQLERRNEIRAVHTRLQELKFVLGGREESERLVVQLAEVERRRERVGERAMSGQGE